MHIEYNYVYAQKLFSSKEMLQLVLCPMPGCIEKKLAPFGYQKIEGNPFAALAYVKEYYTYGAAKKENGKSNSVIWVVFNYPSGLHRYVDFGFRDKDHFISVQKDFINQGYMQVKTASKNLGKEIVSYAQYLRKGSSGILLTITERLIHTSTKIIDYEVSITTISTPNWPDDE